MEDYNIRAKVMEIHVELAKQGYVFSETDIIFEECYPMGGHTGGHKVLPLVISYKDEKTKEKVKNVAKRCGLRNRRNKLCKKDESWLTWLGRAAWRVLVNQIARGCHNCSNN